jgi:hypothetical protein
MTVSRVAQSTNSWRLRHPTHVQVQECGTSVFAKIISACSPLAQMVRYWLFITTEGVRVFTSNSALIVIVETIVDAVVHDGDEGVIPYRCGRTAERRLADYFRQKKTGS